MKTDLVGAIVRHKDGGNSLLGIVRAVAVSSCSSRMTLYVECDGHQLKAVDHSEVTIEEQLS